MKDPITLGPSKVPPILLRNAGSKSYARRGPWNLIEGVYGLFGPLDLLTQTSLGSQARCPCYVFYKASAGFMAFET